MQHGGRQVPGRGRQLDEGTTCRRGGPLRFVCGLSSRLDSLETADEFLCSRRLRCPAVQINRRFWPSNTRSVRRRPRRRRRLFPRLRLGSTLFSFFPTPSHSPRSDPDTNTQTPPFARQSSRLRFVFDSEPSCLPAVGLRSVLTTATLHGRVVSFPGARRAQRSPALRQSLGAGRTRKSRLDLQILLDAAELATQGGGSVSLGAVARERSREPRAWEGRGCRVERTV